MVLKTQYEGKCHTLTGYDMGSGRGKGATFILDPQLKYVVYIHDPRFYLHTWEPLLTPGIRMLLNEGLFYQSKFISVTKHIKMNQNNKPCNVEPNYNFQLCVRNSLTSEVGCRPPWDLWSSPDFPCCTEMDKLKMFERINTDMFLLSDLEDIIYKTGCIAPCVYKEYKLVAEPDKINSSEKILYLAFAENEIIVDKEIEIYSWISLLSDIGGALGLFLGFSFVMVWDAVEVVIRKMKRYLRDRSDADF